MTLAPDERCSECGGERELHTEVSEGDCGKFVRCKSHGHLCELPVAHEGPCGLVGDPCTRP